MGKNRYTIVLCYDPQDAEIHQKVIARLARLDPNATEKFNKNPFTGRLIIKRNADPATATRLKQLFEPTGAVSPGGRLFLGQNDREGPRI